MFGMGFQEIIVVVIVAGIVMLFSAARKQNSWSWVVGPVLVLKKFQINRSAVGQADIIHIVGRPGGLLSWLSTILGLETETSLRVNCKEISSKDSSLFGQKHTLVAISSVSSVHCGYRKPVGYFFMSAISFLGGLAAWISGSGFGSFFGGLIFAVILFVCYFLRKTIQIALITRGGTQFGISFQRSVIENIAVDIQQAKVAISIINKLIANVQKTDVDVSASIADAVKETQSTKSGATNFCIHCGATLEAGSKFCTSCGHGN